MPLTLYGTEENKIELTIKNADVSMREGADVKEFIKACNYSRITLENMTVNGSLGECLIRTRSDGEVDIRDITCDLPSDSYVLHTDEEYVIKAI